MARLPGTLRDRRRKVLETERLSLLELCEGNVEGELLYWELYSYARHVKEGFGNLEAA